MRLSLLKSCLTFRAARWSALALFVLWFAASGPRGMLMAHLDQACGHLEVKTMGYPVRWRGEYRRLLREKYGVELHAEAGCVVTPWLVAYVEGYNSVAKRLLNEKFGKDIFRECADQAEKETRAEHPDE